MFAGKSKGFKSSKTIHLITLNLYFQISQGVGGKVVHEIFSFFFLISCK